MKKNNFDAQNVVRPKSGNKLMTIVSIDRDNVRCVVKGKDCKLIKKICNMNELNRIVDESQVRIIGFIKAVEIKYYDNFINKGEICMNTAEWCM